MAVTISLINMKGGVGKSTLAVNLAWYFADEWGGRKRVLLVDLDPQFNASQYLFGQAVYARLLRQAVPTVWDILEQRTRVPTASPAPFDVRRAIQNRVNITGGGRLDAILSRLELALSLETPYNEKQQLLAESLAAVQSDYDVILIDCAPTESILTKAAYLASDYLLVPVKPEYLSTIGLPLLVNSMQSFNERYPGQGPDLAGVVFNMTTEYSPEEALSKTEVRSLAQQNGWHVFSNEVTYSRSYPKGAREGLPINRTSHSRGRKVAHFYSFAREFAVRVGL
jgi:chromosome partitioning protein